MKPILHAKTHEVICVIDGLGFESQNLTGIDFHAAELSGANLRDTTLALADLSSTCPCSGWWNIHNRSLRRMSR